MNLALPKARTANLIERALLESARAVSLIKSVILLEIKMAISHLHEEDEQVHLNGE